jgi:hypothetical protein
MTNTERTVTRETVETYAVTTRDARRVVVTLGPGDVLTLRPANKRAANGSFSIPIADAFRHAALRELSTSTRPLPTHR